MIADERLPLASIGAALCLLGACASDDPPPPPEPKAPPATEQVFEEQRLHAPTEVPTSRRDWSQLPDFDQLRTTWGDREDFAELCELERPLKEAFEALAQKSWPEVLRVVTPRLDACPVDIDLHLLQAAALDELGRTEESKDHARWHVGLVDSILRSGDGRTAQTAWVVISIAEEYSILRVFGMERKAQSLVERSIDRLDVEIDGKPYVVYFDPAAHFRRLAEHIGPPK